VLKNRKGAMGRQLMYAYFLFMLVVIGGGIVAGVFIFYGTGYDFRKADSVALNFEIKKCILEKEIDFGKDSIYEKCSLNEKIIDEGKYSIGIFKNGNEVLRFRDYVICKVTAKKGVDFPKCTITKFLKGNDEFEVVIGSNQLTGRKLK